MTKRTSASPEDAMALYRYKGQVLIQDGYFLSSADPEDAMFEASEEVGVPAEKE